MLGLRRLDMMSRRTVGVLILVVMGLLQLWDSRVFTAGAPAIALALAGLGLPVGALLFVDRLDVRFASVVACAILLLTAKAFAPHPLPAVGIIALMALAANWLAESKKLAEAQKAG
jgi:hypothetical protein